MCIFFFFFWGGVVVLSVYRSDSVCSVSFRTLMALNVNGQCSSSIWLLIVSTTSTCHFMKLSLGNVYTHFQPVASALNRL